MSIISFLSRIFLLTLIICDLMFQDRPLPRVLCWILTDPNDLEKRTRHVRDTWAKRCDVTLFMSSKRDDSFPTIGLNVPPGRCVYYKIELIICNIDHVKSLKVFKKCIEIRYMKEVIFALMSG